MVTICSLINPCLFGHSLVHVFQAADTRTQAQQVVQRLDRFRKGTLDAEPLGPLLQDVGKLPLGQAQGGVEGDGLDLLALARAVDETVNVQQAEDGPIGAGMGLGETFAGSGRGVGGPVADITVAGLWRRRR